MSMKNSNRCNEIVVWDWQREGIGITDSTVKEIGIKLGLAWDQEWEWE